MKNLKLKLYYYLLRKLRTYEKKSKVLNLSKNFAFTLTVNYSFTFLINLKSYLIKELIRLDGDTINKQITQKFNINGAEHTAGTISKTTFLEKMKANDK